MMTTYLTLFVATFVLLSITNLRLWQRTLIALLFPVATLLLFFVFAKRCLFFCYDILSGKYEVLL